MRRTGPGSCCSRTRPRPTGPDAHGRRRRSSAWRPATSFYPGKNLGAYGDAGAVLDRRAELARAGAPDRQPRRRRASTTTTSLGFNSRLDALQAVVLHAKLRRTRRTGTGAGPHGGRPLRRAARPTCRRSGCPRPWPATSTSGTSTWCASTDRDRVLAALPAGIGAGIHYPVPFHLLGAFADLGHRPGDFPNAEEAAARLLSLPMHPHLGVGQQERIAEIIHEELA